MMSFSKAKLKRFNDITDFSSPFVKDKDKKKDKHTEDKKKKAKELFRDDNAIDTSDKKSKLRLFRTPSLPYRLKFRQVSDLTPSKKSSKKVVEQPAEIQTPASVVTAVTPQKPPQLSFLFRKSERNLLEKKSRDEKYIAKLQLDIDKLNKQIKDLEQQNVEKIHEINDLNFEIDNMKIAEVFLEKTAMQAIDKINKSDEKVKEILQNHDVLLHHMDRMSSENENLMKLNEKLTKSNDEFIKINEERIKEMEKQLAAKCEELHKLKYRLHEKNNIIKNFEFELGKKTVENLELSTKLEKSDENLKIFEVQHEGNLKMLKNSYENEIFFLNSQLTKVQTQLVKMNKSQKKIQSMDLESQIDFENQKTKFEMEKRNYDITIKNYQNIIEVISLRLKKSDTDVEYVMKENAQLKSENKELRTNYENLRSSAENLKKSFDDKNKFVEQLMSTSESEMITMVGKMNDYFNEKFFEIAELKKSFDIRDKNLKKMTSTVLEEYTIGIELARIELDEKQKKLTEYENEIKSIKFENLQLKMKLSEGMGTAKSLSSTTLATIEEETATDDEKKNIQEREEENMQLKLKLKELDRKFNEFENAALQREKDYKQIIEQQRMDAEQMKGFEKLKEANLDLRAKIQKLQDNYQFLDSPTKTPTKRALLLGKENQSPIFTSQSRHYENSPKNALKPRN
ncbi:putative leucine-rich repeat-containing protein DDB_G0290503 [Chironomus tepperi]|uniref:putative leucine-rich repeat-containing protein DDB_G0290503 n=1 Tax=Chironomus tepperi TaxID=113505 RepID=UPI00391F119F